MKYIRNAKQAKEALKKLKKIKVNNYQVGKYIIYIAVPQK